MLTTLDGDNFSEITQGGGIALIDCWAPWCAACKDFTPIFEAAAERHSKHVFAKFNTHENDELTKHLKVTHIPTIILFRDGLLLLRQPGHLSASEIDEVIEKAESIDMDQVRSDMEAREQSTTS
jgi:thioredoxin 1